MRLSNYYLPTLKETPADAEIISHQLMLRAGLIKQTTSGIYTWLPLGLRVYRKIEAIIREEMNRIGALEVDLPSAQPADLWKESGRWSQYGEELLRFSDRHQRDYCIGPTHEEVITDLIRDYINSYKQLPVTLYQIQKKFRDERRPRFGVMRSREFIMKDAYSFHLDETSLKKTYQDMYSAYCTIFDRIGLDYRPVNADNGSIGGSGSHEFQVIAETGEDFIAISDSSDYAANLELAECLIPDTPYHSEINTLTKIHTPNCKTINDVYHFLNIPITQTIKTLIVQGENDTLIALCLRGDHSLNELKAEKINGIISPLQMATEEQVKATLGCSFGSIGPIQFTGRVIVDRACAIENSITCGANENDYHYQGLNWDRDLKDQFEIFDIRNIKTGDKSPDGKGKIIIQKGIEVGHIFQLGDKYTQSMNASVLNEVGKSVVPTMGCYGIGVTRIVAASIEQNHDKNGILWPKAIAPFSVVIAPIGYKKSESVTKLSDQLYQQLEEKGIEVLLDDRGTRPGVMFSELDLIGIPHRLVISEKNLKNNQVEYKNRTKPAQLLPLDQILQTILEITKS